MFSPLFWFFAALTLLFGIGVVVNRNPVASALSLVISFMGLAALFVGLDAYLIGVLQVLVYAGAVMVLFLFIIMLLDLRAERRRQFNFLGVVGGALVALGFASQLLWVLLNNPAGNQKFPPLQAKQAEFAPPRTLKTFVSAKHLPSGAPSVSIETEEAVELLPIHKSQTQADLTPSAAMKPIGTAAETMQVQPLTASAATAIEQDRPAPSMKKGEIDDVRQIGWSIFTLYNLPLQVVGVLLLVSTVGVVVLSKRELK